MKLITQAARYLYCGLVCFVILTMLGILFAYATGHLLAWLVVL